jgi:hypothetical protein
MLGYELPTDYKEYEQLDVDFYEMLTKKAESQAVDLPTIADPNPPKDVVLPDTAVVPKGLTLDQLRELDNWQQLAFRKLKRDEDMRFPWVANELDEQTAAAIRSRLPGCKTEDDVRAAFDLSAKSERIDMLALAASLDRAVDAIIVKED